MDRDSEKAAVEYLLSLTADERSEAFDRVNAQLKLAAPVDEVSPPPPITLLGDYVDSPLEHPPYLVEPGLIVKGEITVTIGRAGKGKTTLVTNRMVRWGAGVPLFDDTKVCAPVKPLRILLIENEGAAYRMKENFQKLVAAQSFTKEQMASVRENVAVWGDGGYSGLKVDRPEDLELIRRGVELHKPDLVILEPFRGIWRGEENNAEQTEAVLDSLSALAVDYECAILLSHHERKGGVGDDGDWMSAARGSGVLEGHVAVMENFREVKEGELRELKWSKNRYEEQPAGLRLRWNAAARGYDLVPDSEIEQAILHELEEDAHQWWTKGDLAEVLGEAQTKLTKPIDDLLDKERIVKKKREQGGYNYRIKTSDKDDGNNGLEY